MNGASIAGTLGILPVNSVGYWVERYCKNLFAGYSQNRYMISYGWDFPSVHRKAFHLTEDLLRRIMQLGEIYSPSIMV